MRRTIAAALAVCALVVGLPATAAGNAYERFFGRFEGTASVEGERNARTLSVKIGPWEEGFVVEWTTLIPKADGAIKRAAYEVRFKATRRESIYASAMRRNMFGHARPLDPLKGEPYVWARIEGDVLTVYTMRVTDEGGYEMQSHRRQLVDEGMALLYTRVVDGEVMRAITGTLGRLE